LRMKFCQRSEKLTDALTHDNLRNMSQGNTEILESGRFDNLDTETSALTDAEIIAISYRTIWNNDFTQPDQGVIDKLLAFAKAVSNESIKQLSSKA